MSNLVGSGISDDCWLHHHGRGGRLALSESVTDEAGMEADTLAGAGTGLGSASATYPKRASYACSSLRDYLARLEVAFT